MVVSDDFNAGMKAQWRLMVRKGWRPPPEGDPTEPKESVWHLFVYGVLVGLGWAAVVVYFYGSQLIPFMSK